MLSFAHQPHPPSYYAATAHAWGRQPPLQEDASCDVCVVGGGLAGLSAALNLAEKGFSVILLEGAEVGFGASGRNGGQVIAGFASDIAGIRAQVGAEAAKAMWDMSVEAVEIIDERVRHHGIPCDWQRGYVSVAVKPRQMRELEDWRREAESLYGYADQQLWDQETLRGKVGSERYVGGLFDPRSGHLHPLNYTLGLAGAALAAGVRIYEQTPVLRLEKGQQPKAHAERGSVSSRHLVLACNAYIGALAPELERRIMPAGTYVIATEPLGAARAGALIADNMAVCDTNFVLDYYRLSADHRLLFGGKVSYSGREPRDLAASMRADMLHVFPQLAGTRVDYAWGGFCDITVNRAPDFGRLDGNIYYLQGFSGHGVNITGIAGKIVAEAIAGTASRLDLFAKIRHRDFPGGKLLRTPALVLGMAYYRMRDLL
ncbi:FAD-binding oxidoreductase [Chromobacterium sp. IIBBL 290-4]|uniref:NAD(P)/FAD-dependent oxidoreductase n=1 Tax=Chromobacterium sp. IIBBL 290-4 TaxID=2953890 RepID=UPI0020B65880|nr:FAD-binding oxidoreductase [Chromobacterium sp. IIBBL 290-4]UTH74749.1 FAD-binding oxidoreductase [Chromobacterium sp. IIBBL 290-4]